MATSTRPDEYREDLEPVPPRALADAAWDQFWPEPEDDGDGSDFAEDADGRGPGTSDPAVLEQHDDEDDDEQAALREVQG